MDFSSWINGFAVGLGCGVLIGLVILINKIMKYRKAYKFVRHIENHIANDDLFINKRNAYVKCKICDKTIDEIYKESLRNVIKTENS